jgi:hypothetical protein
MKARGALWRGTERQKEKGRRKKSFFLMVFLGFEVGCSLESEFEFAAEFIAVGKIELVFLAFPAASRRKREDFFWRWSSGTDQRSLMDCCS